MIYKNAIVIDANKHQKLNVEVRGEKITSLNSFNEEEESIDLEGKLLIPAAVDIGFNLEDLSSKNSESFDEAIMSARSGGIGALFLYVQNPQIASHNASFVSLMAKEHSFNKIFTLAEAITDDTLNNISIMFSKNIKTIRTSSDISSNLLMRSLQYTKFHDCPLIVQAQNKSLDSAGLMHDGLVSSKLGLPSLRPLSESSEIARVAQIACELNSSVVFNFVSSKASVDVLKNYKDRNQIYSSVALCNLFLDDSSCEDFNTINKTFPPLRSSQDKESLIEAIKDGTIDCIASNHQARNYVSKNCPFEDASFGLANSAIFYSLLYTHVIKNNKLSWQEVLRATSLNPARIMSLNTGEIEVGKDADLVVFDENQNFLNTKDSFFSKSVGNIANYNETIYGKVLKTIINAESTHQTT